MPLLVHNRPSVGEEVLISSVGYWPSEQWCTASAVVVDPDYSENGRRFVEVKLLGEPGFRYKSRGCTYVPGQKFFVPEEDVFLYES